MAGAGGGCLHTSLEVWLPNLSHARVGCGSLAARGKTLCMCSEDSSSSFSPLSSPQHRLNPCGIPMGALGLALKAWCIHKARRDEPPSHTVHVWKV